MIKKIKDFFRLFGYLEFFDNCKSLYSKTFIDLRQKIWDQTYDKVFNSSDFSQSYVNLIFYDKIDKAFLFLNSKDNKLLYIVYLLKLIINILDIFSIFFIKRKFYLIIKKKSIDKNKISVVNLSGGLYRLESIYEYSDDFNILDINITDKVSNNYEYSCILNIQTLFKILIKKIQNLNLKIDYIKDYYVYNNLLCKLLEDPIYNIKFGLSKESFTHKQKMYLKILKNHDTITLTVFDNIFYPYKNVRILSDYVIVPSEYSKKWIYKSDLDKVIVMNKDIYLSNYPKYVMNHELRIGYFPRLEYSKTKFEQDEAFINIVANSDRKFILRMHPQEYKSKTRKEYYEKLIFSNNKNILIDNSESDINSYFAKIDILIGTYNSTLIEQAIIRGKIVILLEDMDECYSNEYQDFLKVLKLEKKDEITNLLKKRDGDIPKFNSCFYDKQNSQSINDILISLEN